MFIYVVKLIDLSRFSRSNASANRRTFAYDGVIRWRAGPSPRAKPTAGFPSCTHSVRRGFGASAEGRELGVLGARQ
jgi:hypothetical protein